MLWELKDWRTRTAKDRGLAEFQILHLRMLIQIAGNLPENRTQLKKISGVGKQTLKKYGDDILALVTGYCSKYGIGRMKPSHVKADAEKYTSSKISASGSNTAGKQD